MKVPKGPAGYTGITGCEVLVDEETLFHELSKYERNGKRIDVQ